MKVNLFGLLYLIFTLFLGGCFFSSDEKEEITYPIKGNGQDDSLEDTNRDTLIAGSYNMAIGFSVVFLALKTFDNEREIYNELKALLNEYSENKPKDRITLMAKEIADRKYDVLGLQEVLFLDSSGKLQSDFINELITSIENEGGPKYQFVMDTLNIMEFGPFVFEDSLLLKFHEGNAFLIHPDHQISTQHSFMFKDLVSVNLFGEDIPSQRALQFVEIVSAGGKKYQLFNTHIELGIGEWAIPRNGQINQLVQLTDSLHSSNLSQVMVGDFNLDPQSDQINSITDSWSDLLRDYSKGPFHSCCFTDLTSKDPIIPTRSIDYIFVKGLTKIFDVQILLDSPTQINGNSLYPSDHALVHTVFETQFP